MTRPYAALATGFCRDLPCPARATCYGLQNVPSLSKLLGAGPAYARRLGTLAAAWYTRAHLPAGYWSAQCRDGGALDLDPASTHWP